MGSSSYLIKTGIAAVILLIGGVAAHAAVGDFDPPPDPCPPPRICEVGIDWNPVLICDGPFQTTEELIDCLLESESTGDSCVTQVPTGGDEGDQIFGDDPDDSCIVAHSTGRYQVMPHTVFGFKIYHASDQSEISRLRVWESFPGIRTIFAGVEQPDLQAEIKAIVVTESGPIRQYGNIDVYLNGRLARVTTEDGVLADATEVTDALVTAIRLQGFRARPLIDPDTGVEFIVVGSDSVANSGINQVSFHSEDSFIIEGEVALERAGPPGGLDF